VGLQPSMVLVQRVEELIADVEGDEAPMHCTKISATKRWAHHTGPKRATVVVDNNKQPFVQSCMMHITVGRSSSIKGAFSCNVPVS